MNLGTTINISGSDGAQDLNYTRLPESDQTRHIKVYLVPATVSQDRYYISITMPGGVEEIPPSRGRDTILLADFTLSEDGETSTIIYEKEGL